MKVILSRKGFDSSNGGYPSPIFTDGKLISLPIPSDDSIKYSQLKFDNTRTYYDLMKELKIKKIKSKKKSPDFTKDSKCHLDPDLLEAISQRKKGWKPCFGQSEQAQTHLHNESVKQDDLFLFFGWFKKTIKNNEKFQFERKAQNLHVIFGYFQIGEIIQVNHNTKIPKWMKTHPHKCNEKLLKEPNNTIYIARENLSWNNKISGAGVFNFSKKLVLTKIGLSRSKWDLPSFFKNVNISYHTKDSWKEEGYFKSADIGQEFVIEDNEEVTNWAKTLIEENYNRTN
jgi:hypothetical protein